MDPFAKPPTISDDYRMAEIYRQSAEVFSVRGFEAASMAEIAESVDLTQGGLYYYIKGKRALLFAIMSYALDLLETEVFHPARRQEDPQTCLDVLVEGYVRLVNEEPSVMTMLAESEDHLESVHASKIRSRKRLCSDFLCDVIASLGRKVGRTRPATDPKAATTRALELIHSVRRWNEGGLMGYGDMAEHIIGEVLGGPAPEELSGLAS
jgi:AcrR family transcriptional regulator